MRHRILLTVRAFETQLSRNLCNIDVRVDRIALLSVLFVEIVSETTFAVDGSTTRMGRTQLQSNVFLSRRNIASFGVN